MIAQPVVDSLDVDRAARRLGGVALRTPTLVSAALDECAGANLYCKAEGLQHTGSFKLRGAWNAISTSRADDLEHGVITYSSGNHGRALAFAARMRGIPCAVVIPSGAPAAKRAAIAREGALVISHDPRTSDRAERAHAEARRRGMRLIAPYDDPAVIAGQGTVAREMLQDAAPLDALIAPVGGGGLLAGCVAATADRENLQIIGVETTAIPKTHASLRAGRRVRCPPGETIADALRATMPGALTFPILRDRAVRIVTVTDDELRHAMRFAFDELGVVCEPSGAAALAAVLGGDRIVPAARVGIVLSGSNIDLAQFAALTADTSATRDLA